jgi:hypothetical protein
MKQIQQSAGGPPRCPICGEPLGMYEPIVDVDGDRVRRTSRAAEPDLSCGGAGSCYHARCFEQADHRQ